jgi:hypothetical protein
MQTLDSSGTSKGLDKPSKIFSYGSGAISSSRLEHVALKMIMSKELLQPRLSNTQLPPNVMRLCKNSLHHQSRAISGIRRDETARLFFNRYEQPMVSSSCISMPGSRSQARSRSEGIQCPAVYIARVECILLDELERVLAAAMASIQCLLTPPAPHAGLACPSSREQSQAQIPRSIIA